MYKTRIPYHIVPAMLLFLWLNPSYSAVPDSLSLQDFIALRELMSEQGGDFHSDNFVSNESSYLHPIPILRRLNTNGGIYVGVAPEQNFTYIAETRPEIAFILDIRRQNMLHHLLYKALFTLSETPEEFLSLLFSKPLFRDLPLFERLMKNKPIWLHQKRSATIQELTAYFDAAESDESCYLRNWERIEPLIGAYGIRSAEDIAVIKAIYNAFYRRHFDIVYDLPESIRGKPLYPYPSLRDLLVAMTKEGETASFLANEASFRFVKEMHRRNLIVPVVGDFAGVHALRQIASYTRKHDSVISVFYTSNVEFYLRDYLEEGEEKPTLFKKYLENVKQLPINDRSLFIRAYHNEHYGDMVSHPKRVGNHIFTTLVQLIVGFLADQEKYEHEKHDFSKEFLQGFTRYRRVVTVGIIE